MTDAGPALAAPRGPDPDNARGAEDGTRQPLRQDGIAVLPFALVAADDPAGAILLDGLVHDVIGRLARLRGFHVIARGSVFALRRLAGDPRAAGRELGVAYVVDGTAQLRVGQVRLRVEIVDAALGAILWTGDFTEPRTAVTDLIGGLADRIVHAVHMQVTAAETRRALAHPRETLDAWESYHAGVPDACRPDPEALARALERFRTAARLSPGFARAHAAQSACDWVRAMTGMTGDPAAERALARRTAEEAMAADDQDPLSPSAFGRALWLEGDLQGCIDYAGRAVALAPRFALGHAEIGTIEATQGDAARALAPLNTMLALSPIDPILPSALLCRATALHRLGRPDEAVPAARAAVQQPAGYAPVLAPAAPILADAGHIGEARAIATRLRATPSYPGPEALRAAVSRDSDAIADLVRRHGDGIGI